MPARLALSAPAQSLRDEAAILRCIYRRAATRTGVGAQFLGRAKVVSGQAYELENSLYVFVFWSFSFTEPSTATRDRGNSSYALCICGVLSSDHVLACLYQARLILKINRSFLGKSYSAQTRLVLTSIFIFSWVPFLVVALACSLIICRVFPFLHSVCYIDP